MPPLHQSATLTSIHSWWSDRNPPGATINLHAAAKPLMRVLYDRQARKLIQASKSAALSAETLDVYMSYLRFRYVGQSTKVAVLQDLEGRLCGLQPQFESDIHQVTDSLFDIHSDIVYDLLASPNRQIKHGVYNLLGRICVQEYQFPATFHARCATILISTPFDADIRFQVPRLNALAGLCYSTCGAEAVADALVASSAHALAVASQVEEVLWFTVSLLIQHWTSRDLELVSPHFFSQRTGRLLDIVDQRTLLNCAITALHHTLTGERASSIAIDHLDLLRHAPTIMRRDLVSPSRASLRLRGEFTYCLGILLLVELLVNHSHDFKLLEMGSHAS